MGKREYKDSVFVHLFSKTKDAITNFASFFDALSAFLKMGFHAEVADFEVITLDSSLYSGLRTDVLYHVKNRLLVFVEHQSTYNPNMPLRFLEYAVEVLKTFPYKVTKYGSKALEISNMIFIVLYNGKKKIKDVEVSYLSDLIKDRCGLDVGVEVKVTTLNINIGHNKEFLEKCPVLNEYVLFVSEAERQIAKDKEKGFDIAVDNCIQRGILKDYLIENRRIVMGMFFSQFDMDTELEVVREESYEEGREEGREEGILATAKNFLSLGVPIESIIKATGLSEQEIRSI